MSLGDILIVQNGTYQGGRKFNVNMGLTINAGEPVVTTRGNTGVQPMATNKPAFNATTQDYLVGIAVTTSTSTATATGTVNVLPLQPGITYLIKPNSAAAWDTQAEYDALVGKYVLIDLTTGSYTILATDGASNGCIIQALNIAENPGMIAFQFRQNVYAFN